MYYKMPAEWEPHEATWLAWPHNQDHWPGKLKTIPPVYAEITRVLLESEKVYICVNDQDMEKSARVTLHQAKVEFNSEQVKFFHIPTDASWTRDHGPIFVRDEKRKLIITDWVYNAWGNKWPHLQDDIIPQKIGKIFNIPVVEPGIVLEGGSVDVNGKGTLITTRQCLLNKNRNPQLSQKQIEKYLHDFLGAINVLWLEEGIVGDDTDGHVDDIAKFVNPTTVVCAVEDNEKDNNYLALQKNYKALQGMTDQDGNKLTTIPLPMPEPIIYQGIRLPASYINFYISNKAVLVPTFRSSRDKEVIKKISGLFPDRKVTGIDCTDLIWGFGAIHCSTQQQPVP